MPALYTSLGPWTVHTFTLALSAAALLVAIVTLRPLPAAERGAYADGLLAALVGAALGGRLFHVLLDGAYFADRTEEALRLTAGGLEWHGALFGGLLALAGLARLRFMGGTGARVDYLAGVLHRLTWALPLLTLAGWYGCWASGCGTGLEVATLAGYPPWAVAEYPDVYGLIAPRWFTPGLGMALGAAALLLTAVLRRRPRRFAWTLAFLSAGMFVIGIFRADRVPLWFGLRADQVLDGLCAALSLAVAVGIGSRSRKERQHDL